MPDQTSPTDSQSSLTASRSSVGDPIMTLDWVLSYLKGRARFLVLFAGVGLLLGIFLLLVTPKRYEASFLIKMPTANAINEFGVMQPHLIKVVPPAFDAKKLLLKPELFSGETLAACGYGDTNADRKSLVKSIYSTEADYGSSVLVAVRVPGKETAQACADRIIADVIAFANAEKNNFVRYTLQVNKNISAASMVNTDAKLTAPVRISDRPVSPRTWHLLIGLALFGLLLGCVFDWLRYLYISRNHLEASDWAPGANS
jgi:hypothetical protein